jgi:alkaline phosphatase
MMKEIGDDFVNGMKNNPFGVLQYGEQSGGINMMKTQDGSIDVAIGGGKMYFDTQALLQRGYSVGCGYGSMKQLQNQNRRVIFYNDSAYPPKAHEGRNSQGPFLADASESILKTMFENPLGSFTMIEGSQVDWAGHENDSAYLMAELADLDVTIQRVLAMAKENKETLIVITADHETGGLSLVGWDKKGHRPVLNFSTHEHTGIPVPVFAYGPGAEAFGGSYQNTQVFYKIKALLEQPAEKK